MKKYAICFAIAFVVAALLSPTLTHSTQTTSFQLLADGGKILAPEGLVFVKEIPGSFGEKVVVTFALTVIGGGVLAIGTGLVSWFLRDRKARKALRGWNTITA